MPAKGAKDKGPMTKGAKRSNSRSKKAAPGKGRAPAKSRGLLPEKDLSLHYHILKLLVGSIFRTPDDQINVDDVLERTKDWLIISPFTRPRLKKGLTTLASKRLLETIRENGKVYYRITETGEEAYKQYRQVMTLWRIEKVAGERLKLYSISEVLRKESPRERDYIPDECFMEWPLKFRPVFHRFSGTKELRIYDAFEKLKK